MAQYALYCRIWLVAIYVANTVLVNSAKNTMVCKNKNESIPMYSVTYQ